MLNQNIKALRKSKGLSQAECGAADHLKMGAGLSVPDSDLLIALSEALETPVSTLLGETVVESEASFASYLTQWTTVSCRKRAQPGTCLS